MAGDAKFPPQKNIERRIERPRDFVADRHAAARQRKHQRVRAVGVVRQFLCQKLTRLSTVTKRSVYLAVCESAGNIATHEKPIGDVLWDLVDAPKL